MAPLAPSRSIRRLTAGADSPTSAPISASVARAFRSRQPMTRPSMVSTLPRSATDRRSGVRCATYRRSRRNRRRLLALSPAHSVRLDAAPGALPVRALPRGVPAVTTVLPTPRPVDLSGGRAARPRRYLMCRPEHFEVSYAINPWMDVTRAVDRDLAVRQWETLRETYLGLGHEVQIIDPEPGLPDMVFAATGGLAVGGRAMGARFTHPERLAEGPAYFKWLAGAGLEEASQPLPVAWWGGGFLAGGDPL